MPTSPKLRFGIAAAGLTCLIAGYVSAQQAVRDRERTIDRPAAENQTIGQGSEQAGGQIDRATTPRREYTANFRGQQANAGNQIQEVQRYVVACLLNKNQGEVEIGELAQQQSQNPKVKEFAQMMVQDHGKLVKQLQQLKSDRSTAATTLDATDQPAAARTTTAAGAESGDSAVNQLIALDRQIAERCLQAAREELQQKQGVEFDKCYVGSQIAGHMHMLAALEVLQQQGPQQIQQIAQQAQPQVKQHLDQAKQIMKELEGLGATDANSRAARQPTTPQR